MIIVCNAGRFGNQFFINFVQQKLSRKYNLYVQHYRYYNQFKQLGVEFDKEFANDDEKDYTFMIEITDKTVDHFMAPTNDLIRNTIVFLRDHYQTSAIAREIRAFLELEPNKNRIIECNEFSARYNSNNDVFVHVRNGDLLDRKNGETLMNNLDYYDSILSTLDFENGYISSENLETKTCKTLIEKYKLIPFSESKTKTIQFASTCNHVILSPGTFSWMIGVFSFFSKNIVYCPPKSPWHGNIFIFEDWKLFKNIIA